MTQKIFLIRPYVDVGTLGPVPPLELLYTATQIERYFKNYDMTLLDMGLEDGALESVKSDLQQSRPDVVCLDAYVWEAGMVYEIASLAKECRPECLVVVLGQLAFLAKDQLLRNRNIDYVVVGEPEITIKEFLEVLAGQRAVSDVDGLVYKAGESVITNDPRIYPDNIDHIDISPSAWDLVRIKKYAKYANWNGAIKEKFYVPILTSRGCPFSCTFCRETYGKRFLARTPENVVNEIKMLQKKYGAKEFHIYDAVFNYDVHRAKRICDLIVEADLGISLAFPHGIRVDLMTDELIRSLKRAGTYKLVYGIETASPRIQKNIRKNLDLERVRNVIRRTSRAGIIVGGYFMLGHDSETREEIEQTIDFAASSELDIASFFKAVKFNDLENVYQEATARESDTVPAQRFEDFGYYAAGPSYQQMPPERLNAMILKAQQRFYLNGRRALRGFRKAPRKMRYLKNVMQALAIILQGYLLVKLRRGCESEQELAEASERGHP